ncbi:MAG: hypothetical protein RLZZ586_459 [Pseudomonadota bacterium]
MGLFNAVLGGKSGADIMCQALFNVVAFLPYCSRANYQDFNDFWHAKVKNANGAEERLNQIFFNYSAHFTKDEQLLKQLSQATLEIEKYWISKYGLSGRSIALFSVLKKLADQYLPDGTKAQESDFMHGASHPNPETRVAQCMLDLMAFEALLPTLAPTEISPDERTHFFVADLYENAVSHYKYSGSDLKVYEEDSYFIDSQTYWGRWGLFRNSTLLTDTWIVLIKNDVPTVQKIVIAKADGDFDLDEEPKKIEIDPEILAAISKTKSTGVENAASFGMPPKYLQMIAMLNTIHPNTN